MQPIALYVHIPFYETKCPFNAYAKIESLIPGYVSALRTEIELWACLLGSPPGGQTYSLPLLSVIRFTAPVSIVHAGTGADASGPGYRTGRVTGRQPGIGPTSAEIPRLRTQDLGVLTYLL